MTRKSEDTGPGVRAVLLDLEGVLYQEGAVVAGAPEAIEQLRAAGLAIRFLTNTTTRSRRSLVEKLQAMGFDASPAQVFAPAVAAARILRERGLHRVHLAADPSLAEDLREIDLVDHDAEAVVMGDLFRGFTWDRLNRIYGLLADGAQLIALHRNRYCRRDGELALDLGPFVAALEYASGREAVVVGKPSDAFYAGAVQHLELAADQVLMIGDDIEADILGAVDAGIPAMQVRTGKYRPEDEARHAHLRLESIAELPAFLGVRKTS